MIRDILVNLTEGVEKDAACDFAASMALRFHAHLTGVSVSYEIDVPPFYMGALPTDFIEAQFRENEEAAKKAAARFSQKVSALNVPHEVQTLTASLGVAAQQFLEMSRLYDLTIVSQPNPDKPGPEEVIAENVLMDSGRAVLVVPYEQVEPFKGERILLAWDGGRAAARALAEAMPLLNQASTIDVLRVGGDADESRVSVEELERHLSRHELKVQVHTIALESGQSVSGVIMEQARTLGSDLVVMGGYGHSRLREMVLGGVTREIFTSMSVPVLMAH
ncbi:universal stress protein [Xanthobacter sp. TB0139]|uniref:universal stress protein n=1 Tax=Xanthobacter sp. TB0139 TaxID=3459178 RepID=UPI004039C449